jgi:hypothetical protein
VCLVVEKLSCFPVIDTGHPRQAGADYGVTSRKTTNAMEPITDKTISNCLVKLKVF